MKYLLLILTLILTSCQNQNSSKYLVFDYYDFGPQAMSWETIGMGYYEWHKTCPCEIDNYNIKIIVYEGSLEDAQKLYKEDQNLPVDYRYLSKNEAIAYLKENMNLIIEFQEKEEGIFDDMLLDFWKKLKKIEG